MELLGSVTSALPGAAAGVVRAVVVWGDSAAWCEIDTLGDGGSNGGRSGAPVVLARGVFRGVVVREEQGNKCNG